MLKYLPMFKLSCTCSFVLVWLSVQLLYSSAALGQDSLATLPVKDHNLSIGGRFYYGSYFTSQPKAEYIRDSYASFGEVYVEKTTTGKEEWQVSHNYPSAGIGFLFGNPGSKKYIGTLYALYPYIRFPLLSSHSYKGSLKIGGGAALISKPYDVYTNPKNTLIGTRFNAFLSLVLQNEIKLSDRLYLDAGIGIMHISNGSTTLPNLGLNIPNINAGLRFALSEPVIRKRKAVDSSSSKIDLAAYTSVSIKQYPWVGGSYYLINAVQMEASKRVRRNYSLGAGILLIYNRTLRRYITEDRPENPTYKKFQAGIYLSYEHFLGRLSIPVQVGPYIYNGSGSGIFQQYGVRFRATGQLSVQALLKSHSGQADFIHVGAGYNF